MEVVARVVLPVEDVAHRGHQGLPLGGGAAADADDLRLEDVDQAGHPAAQVVHILVDDLARGGIALGGCA